MKSVNILLELCFMNMALIRSKIFANGDNIICFVLKQVSSACFSVL